VNFDELSRYTDSVADPMLRSWRYRLSVVDYCGNESDLSDHHKTMHLTMNLGLEGDVNLIWDHYEGFPIDQYKIRRYDAATGWINLADMPANLTSRTDEDPPKENLTYYIELFHPTGCTATERKASTLNSSRSNRITRLRSTVGGTEGLKDMAGLRIYPNPGTGLFNLQLDITGVENVTAKDAGASAKGANVASQVTGFSVWGTDLFVKVVDLSGKLIVEKEYKNITPRFETRLDLSGCADGMYLIQVKTGNALWHRILIKE
jgi:hypothetical protein